MSVTSDGKWLSVEPLDAPMAEAAEEFVKLRMADVLELLPRAARSDSDMDSVHQLRVSCRRAAAGMRAFRPLMGRPSKKLDQWLKGLRRAAGPARDADVLLARLQRNLDQTNPYAHEVLAKVDEARADARRKLTALGESAADGRLKSAVKNCRKDLRKSKARQAKQPFVEFAREALTAVADDLSAIDAQDATLDELHQLRIAAKRLRYSIELFHSAADPRLRSESYPVVEELQDRLGALNDRASAQAIFQAWLGNMPPDGLAAYVAGLVIAERSAAEEVRHDLLRWCLPAKQAELLARLDAVRD